MAGRLRAHSVRGGEKKHYYTLRILFLLILIVVVVLGSLVLFQYFKIIDLKNFMRAPSDLPPVHWQEMDLLETDRLENRLAALDQKAEALEVKSRQLSEQEARLAEEQKQVQNSRKALNDEKKRLSEAQKLYDKKKETITQTSVELTQMDENAAVKILESRDNQDIIWIMKVTDELAAEAGSFSLVPVWLELMDPARASEIQRERDLIPDLEIK